MVVFQAITRQTHPMCRRIAGARYLGIRCPVEVFHTPARDDGLIIVTNDSSMALVPGG